MDQIAEDDFVTPSIVFQIGIPPGRIDILTQVSGLDFDTAWKNRTTLRIEDLKLFVIGRKELILNKRASGRPKGIADLYGLGEM